MTSTPIPRFKRLSLVKEAIQQAVPRPAVVHAIIVGAHQEMIKAAVDKFDADGDERLAVDELEKLRTFWEPTGSLGKQLWKAIDVCVLFEPGVR